jgi:Fe-S cluster assembly protein SufB
MTAAVQNPVQTPAQSPVQNLVNQPYKYGFITDIESDVIPRGLSEDVVRLISAKKEEPEWMLDIRLRAYRTWLKMTEPTWAHVQYPPIDYQNIIYYSAPKVSEKKKSLDEVDPELLDTFEKLGISLSEQKRLANVAVDAIFDSVSIATTFKEKLAEHGVIFCSMSEAVKEHPELIKKYLGSVVPVADNYYSALNAAVFSDGSFVYIPKGVKCPMELSTYFRINNGDSGQFERTLIVAEAGSQVSYLEGCTAPMYDSNQLHAAVVELVAMEDADIKYSTVQNWYAGDKDGKGGIYNFVTKRGICQGKNSKISWTQVETGSAITWKYPSCILVGDNSVGEFYSVALTNHHQQADTGSKMIHIGKNTKSTIVSKGISAGQSHNSYRGLVKMGPKAEGARNYSQCDSMLIGDRAEANTFPYIQVQNNAAKVEHEASTSKIGEDQLFYFQQRGISMEDAISMMISGFCKDVFSQLPMEFALEADKLLALKLEGSVG